MELNPQVVFERLFGSGATPEMRAARMRQNRSILDSIRGELASLKKELGAGDRRTVNQYTDEIREIERRIQLAAKASATVPEIDLPPGIPESFDEHIKLHFDLTALAFQADITRVATLLGARDLTGRSYRVPEERALPERRRQRRASTAGRTTRTIRPRSGATPTSTATTCRRWRTSPRS